MFKFLKLSAYSLAIKKLLFLEKLHAKINN